MASDDIETGQTIDYMDALAAKDSGDPAVLAATCEALDQAGLTEASPAFEKACAVFWWLKRHIRYVPTPGTSPLVDQTLISPTAVLAMPEAIGDCPQFSMLAAAMFRVLCMDSRFVTIAAEEMFPGQWSHVYNTVEIYPGQFMPFDSSNGPEPGAEFARPTRRKIWARIAPGKCAGKEKGRDMIKQSRPPSSMRNRRLRTALTGRLGDIDCDDAGNCVDTDTGLSTTPTEATDSSNIVVYPDQTASTSVVEGPYSVGSSSAPTSSSTGIASTLSTLFNDATAVAAPVVKAAVSQPYYITNAQGQQVLYNPATGTTVGSSLATSLGAVSPVVWIGAGLVLILLLAKK